MEGDPVELGVELLGALDAESVTIAEALDRIETITTDPRLTRQILQRAEADGYIERTTDRIRPTGPVIDFEAAVITKEGSFTCQRCGASISTGYFLDLDAGDVGPFGSSCIRKVTGRD